MIISRNNFLTLPAGSAADTAAHAVEDVLRSPVNLSAAPLAGQVLCGSSWYFQAWFREPETVGSGGAGFNLSSGLEGAFMP